MKSSKRLFLCLILLGLFLTLPAGAVFADVEGSWCAPAVEDMTEKGILSGFPDGTFRPGDWIKRGEAAKIVSVAIDTLPYTLPQTGTGSFSDVERHWSQKHVRQLLLEKVILPQDYGTAFHPDQRVTRLEMVRMLLRMLGFAPSSQWEESGFPDLLTLSPEDRFYCEKAVEIGLIEGYPDGLFRPDFPLSRAQAAVILHRALPLESLSIHGLPAYKEDNTIPQVDFFLSTVENSAVSATGEYQGQPMHLYRYTLPHWDALQLKNDLSSYEKILAYQRYSLVEQTESSHSISYLFSDLLGSRTILLLLRAQDPETGKPSLTLGILDRKNSAEAYAAFQQKIEAETLLTRFGLAPAQFILCPDAAGRLRPTERYHLAQLPAGFCLQFCDRLKAAGFQQTEERAQIGASPALVYQKGAVKAAVSKEQDFFSVMLLAH